MRQKISFIEAISGVSLLCIAGGFLDAYSYTVRGGVLATAQTGNFVFLCVALAAGSWPKATSYLVPILSFCAGTFVAHSVKCAAERRQSKYWRCSVLLFEIATLAVIAFLAQDAVANALISFVSGVQLCVFRVADGNTVATTMCTGNLRSAMDSLFHFRQTGERQFFQMAVCYFCMIALFLLGALSAAYIAPVLGKVGVLIACAPLLAAGILHRVVD